MRFTASDPSEPDQGGRVGREPVGPVEWSRRAIISILTEVLPDQAGSLTILGGHAVMLRCPQTFGLVLPTSDGDFAVTPIQVNDQPSFTDALRSAGFEPRDSSRPGLWGRGRRDASGLVSWDEQIDFLCPGSLTGNVGRSRRSVTVLKTTHGTAAVGVADGIELATVDRGPVMITDLADPSRSVEANVAGIPALVCAKSYKLGERLERIATRPQRVLPKDFGDLFLLMANSDPEETAQVFNRHSDDSPTGKAIALGRRHFANVLRSPIALSIWREATEQILPDGVLADLLSAWRRYF
jgi:hypothetical protein